MSGGGDPGVPFDVWAEVSARLLRLAPDERADVLDALGVDQDAWTPADAHWTAALASDVAAGRTDRATQYGARCADELRRRRAAAPRTGAVGAGDAPLPDATSDVVPVLASRPPLPFCGGAPADPAPALADADALTLEQFASLVRRAGPVPRGRRGRGAQVRARRHPPSRGGARVARPPRWRRAARDALASAGRRLRRMAARPLTRAAGREATSCRPWGGSP